MLILRQGLSKYIYHILVCIHVGVVNYPGGMESSTIVIVHVDMLCACFYNSSCDLTKYALIVAIDREWWCVFAMHILVELEQPFRFM